jgi:hypothetical protein
MVAYKTNLGGRTGAYKAKFNQWGFVKTLSRDWANWMLVKASRRKQEENKDTVFEIGDQIFTVDRAQQSLKRTRGGRDSVALERSKERTFHL